jgi:putative ABC transport system permease protein
MSTFSSKLPRGIRRIFRLPVSTARLLRDADEELRFHFAMRVEELRALGMSEVDAETEAARRFGDTDEFRDYSARRAARRGRWHAVVEWIAEWTQDIRFAKRQFQRTPAVTTLVAFTLALGIGANTAIFTVVHRLLIAPLPYADGNRIVMLAMEGDDHTRRPAGRVAAHAWRTRAHSVETVAAVGVDAIMVQDVGEQDTIHAFITSNYLRLLGLHPALGREFTLEEEQPGGPGVAMITYGLWQRAYGGRPDVLGSKLDVEGRPYLIVGVTPREMGVPLSLTGAGSKMHEATPSIWLPASLDSVGGDVFAKLRPGVSAQQASRELQAILESDSVFQGRVKTQDRALCCARALRAQDFLDPHEARAVEVLFVAVGVLLLIACANVASLHMSRAWSRRREFAVRVALGARRGRLARLVLTESVALALVGGLLGVAVAWETLRIIIALRPPALADLASVHIESAVLLWSLGISVVTGLLFGSAPALFAGARSVGDVLRSETRTSSGDSTSRRIRSALIVAEIAMSLVLLVGAGLLVRSFVALERTPLGFDPHDLVAVDVLFGPRVPRDTRLAVRSSILDRFRGTPGVTEAAVGTMPGDPYHVEGDSLTTDPDATGQSRSVGGEYAVVPMTPNYFRLTRMSLIAGRLPEPAPTVSADASVSGASSVPVADEVVVNRELARRLWPDGHVIGARLRSSLARGRAPAVHTVVGVVDEIRIPGRVAPAEAVLYEPPILNLAPLIARISGSAPLVAAALRRTVTDAGAVVYYVTIGDDYIRNALAPTRFAMGLLAAFAVIALLLSAVGLYGVIAYSVTQRTREIGVRVALGAEPQAIVAMVIGGGLRLASGGVIIGAAVAAMTTRALGSMLYGISPDDPLTFVAIALLVAAIALLASYLPARRALRIAPTDALRAD